MAAGATWTRVVASDAKADLWNVRRLHTSVIDAAGTIYVIGGLGGGFRYNDVWKGTGSSADRTRGVLRCTNGY